jgi:hypothetical protein
MRTWRFAVSSATAVAAVTLGVWACGSNAPDAPLGDASTDAGAVETSDDGPATADAADSAITYTFNDVTNASLWTTYDLAANVDPSVPGFSTGAFDGQYLYLVPAKAAPGSSAIGAAVWRFDTKSGFTAKASWQIFDARAKLDAGTPDAGAGSIGGFSVAAFDGRYVYFIPSKTGPVKLGGLVLRYDPALAFGDPGSWQTFDLPALYPNAIGFAGTVFDGQYLYLLPYKNGIDDPMGCMVRFDTHDTFDAASAWKEMVIPAYEFQGGAFDGKFVYSAPNGTSPASPATRLDTTQAFAPASSATYDIAANVSANAKGFEGSVFDGRYVYFVPFGTDATTRSGLVTRYDTTAPFAAAASWTTFDTGPLAGNPRGFVGGTFDGRFVYFTPRSNVNGSDDGVVARFDTKASAGFQGASSWSTFDVSTAKNAPNAKGFSGAIFDGRYVYVLPSASTVIARFDAKSPGSLPKRWNSSFF